MLTGLGRRDVRKQRESAKNGQSPGSLRHQGVARACRRGICFRSIAAAAVVRRCSRSRARPSFMALVQSCGGSHVPPTTLLKELVSAGAVRVRPDGRLQGTHRNYIPQAMDGQMIPLGLGARGCRHHARPISAELQVRRAFRAAAVNGSCRRGRRAGVQRFLERKGRHSSSASMHGCRRPVSKWRETAPQSPVHASGRWASITFRTVRTP